VAAVGAPRRFAIAKDGGVRRQDPKASEAPCRGDEEAAACGRGQRGGGASDPGLLRLRLRNPGLPVCQPPETGGKGKVPTLKRSRMISKSKSKSKSGRHAVTLVVVAGIWI